MKEWGYGSSAEAEVKTGSHREAQSGKPAPPGFEQLREMPGWAPKVGTCGTLKDWLASRQQQDIRLGGSISREAKLTFFGSGKLTIQSIAKRWLYHRDKALYFQRAGPLACSQSEK